MVLRLSAYDNIHVQLLRCYLSEHFQLSDDVRIHDIKLHPWRANSRSCIGWKFELDVSCHLGLIRFLLFLNHASVGIVIISIASLLVWDSSSNSVRRLTSFEGLFLRV